MVKFIRVGEKKRFIFILLEIDKFQKIVIYHYT